MYVSQPTETENQLKRSQEKSLLNVTTKKGLVVSKILSKTFISQKIDKNTLVANKTVALMITGGKQTSNRLCCLFIDVAKEQQHKE